MSFFNLFKTRGTAPVARERLQILLAHERAALGSGSLLATLREEILATIAKHIDIPPEALKVTVGRQGAVSTLEIDVEIPTDKIAANAAHPSHAAAAPVLRVFAADAPRQAPIARSQPVEEIIAPRPATARHRRGNRREN
jgi:cell division topological specificity factor